MRRVAAAEAHAITQVCRFVRRRRGSGRVFRDGAATGAAQPETMALARARELSERESEQLSIQVQVVCYSDHALESEAL